MREDKNPGQVFSLSSAVAVQFYGIIIHARRSERMELKGKLTMSREEAGKLLKKLGEELSLGKLTYPAEFGKAREISTPKDLQVEVEYKEKGDKKKFEIELEWYNASSNIG